MSDSSVVVDILASGSRGNCAVFSFCSTRLVLDAGISVRQFRTACAERNIAVESITGMALTHEHKDHVAHLQPFRKSWSQWPVWASAGTIRGSVLRGESVFEWQHIRDGRPFRVGEVDILPRNTTWTASRELPAWRGGEFRRWLKARRRPAPPAR